MAGLGHRWKTDDRPQRHGWAPGEYNHARCVGQLCRELEDSSFIGAKRAIICAYAMPDPVPPKPYEPDRELLQKLIEHLKQMNSMVQLPASHEAKYRHEMEQANLLIERLQGRLR